MKRRGMKMISLLLSIVLLAGSVPLNGDTFARFFSPAECFRVSAAAAVKPGDVNRDGEITAADARFALRAAVGLDDSAEGLDLSAADVDGTPGVTAADARLILRAAVGLETLEKTELDLIGEPDIQTQVFENGDFYFTPDEADIAFDKTEMIRYYNDLLTVYTFTDLDVNAASALAKSVDGKIVGDISGAANMLQIRVAPAEYAVLEEKCKTLMENDEVLHAFVEIPVTVADANYSSTDPWSADLTKPESDLGNEDHPAGNDWWAEAIHAYTAWDLSKNVEKENVIVGVLDTRFTHPDIIDNVKFLPGYEGQSENGHGVGVAGFVAAQNNDFGIRGVADQATLLCAVGHFEGSGYRQVPESAFITVNKQMIEAGAKVVNNSWQYVLYSEDYFNQQKAANDPDLKDYSSYADYVHCASRQRRTSSWSAINMMISLQLNGFSDYLIVQCAGNGWNNGALNLGGVDADWAGSFCSITQNDFDLIYSCLSTKKQNRLKEKGIDYKSIEDRKMVVGAVAKPDANGGYQLTGFSNFGSHVDIVAPGAQVFGLSYDPNPQSGRTNSYADLNGTSQAAPMVAGAAALLWSINPTLTAPQLKAILCISGQLKKASGVGRDAREDYPMLNVGLATRSVIAMRQSVSLANVTGKITDAETGLGLYGVRVHFLEKSRGQEFNAITDITGSYSITLPLGDYTVDFLLEDYKDQSISYVIENTTPHVLQNVVLERTPPTEVMSGTCGKQGDNLTWTLDSQGTLTISGQGEMEDYENGDAPWYEQRSKIHKVVFSDEITHIGNYAFYSCITVRPYRFGETTEMYEQYCTLELPEKLTGIGDYAFSFCRTLKIKSFPDSLTEIGDRAFSYTDLTEITIPAKVTKIGKSAFENSDLETITVVNGNPAYSSLNGVLFDKDRTVLICYPAKKADTVYSVPEGVTAVEQYAFMSNRTITAIDLPASLSSIGYWAFYGCSALKSVAMQEGLQQIKSTAFAYTAIESIQIPASVTYIEPNPFSHCYNLREIQVAEGNEHYFDENGVLYRVDLFSDVEYKRLLKYPQKKNGNTFTVPGDTQSIEFWAFQGCADLNEIILPVSVSSIGVAAFQNCSALESIVIPDKITNLTYSVFENCVRLKTITLPSGIEKINERAFLGCVALTDVYFTGSQAAWNSVTIDPFENEFLLTSEVHCMR